MVLWSKFHTPAFSAIVLEVTFELQSRTDISATAMGLSNFHISFVIIPIGNDISTEAHRHSILETTVIYTTIEVVSSAMAMRLPKAPLAHVN
jgi:hypothetical protein